MTDKETVKSRDMAALASYKKQLCKHPRLTYLFIELTDSCNLSCLHCGSGCAPGRRRYIDTQLLLSALKTVAEDFPPASVMICLSGGEPMLHPAFFNIVNEIERLGFPWGMTSNGTLIDRESASLLREFHIGSVSISLDGVKKDHDWLRNAQGCFERTVSGITELRLQDIPVQITTVIHKRNIYSLESIFRMVMALNVQSWRVINIEPIGRALEGYPELLLSNKEFEHLLQFVREKRYSHKVDMDVRFGCSHYLSFAYEREVRDNYFLCGSGIYVASILCNGDVYSCLDIERRPEMVQGNIKTDRFSLVWYERFQEFREDRTEKNDTCRECTERQFCGGDSTHTWDFENNKPKFCFLRK